MLTTPLADVNEIAEEIILSLHPLVFTSTIFSCDSSSLPVGRSVCSNDFQGNDNKSIDNMFMYYALFMLCNACYAIMHSMHISFMNFAKYTKEE